MWGRNCKLKSERCWVILMAFRTTVSHADIEVASLMTQLAKHMQIQVAQMHFLEARLRLQTHPQLN
jgi:hypothetical protein